MVKIIVADTPDEARNEIVKYLDWRLNSLKAQRDQVSSPGERGRWSTVVRVLHEVRDDVAGAHVMAKNGKEK